MPLPRHDIHGPLAALLLASLSAASLQAAEEPAAALAANSAGSGATSNVTINLINRLVAKNVLSKEDAADLIKQAKADAEAVAIREQSMRVAIADAAAPPADPNDVNVSYVPEPVRAQMREEIKADVLADARKQGWGNPKDATPSWVKKWDVFGDFRVRYEGTFFPGGNDNTGAFPNFNAINTGSPFDVSGTQFSPQLNVDQDRNRLRFRARIGAGIELEDGFSAGFRVATGENNSPVSTNQSFGASGGNFSKYSLWLDRAYLAYNFGDKPYSDITAYIGRFENPFFSSEVMWDDDIGFDGMALKGKFELNDRMKMFATGGAFPIFNTDFNFATNQPAKFDSTDKWLLAAQIGLDWKIKDDLTAKFAAAYYDFDGVAGKLSSPFTPLSSADAGDTDGTRPSFAQKGNTYMALRNIVPDASNGNGTTNQYQYFGLATPFRNITLTGRLDYDGYEPVRLSLMGEFIKNIAFDEASVAALAVNNRGPAGTSGPGAFEGGDTAWFLNFVVGDASLDERGKWNTFLGYRYVESDSVVDGFTDSDFGGGGTNMKGFTLGGNYALSPSVRVGARWMSAEEVAGPTLKSDVLQFDINAKF
ncbi:MAG: hypothetical protein JWO82_4284 [Akkermansiaceae bacterium]|nr:hypothetical protein [Akkermansiaceae bacterium]